MSDREPDRLTWIDGLRSGIPFIRFMVPGREALHPILTRDPLLSALILSLFFYLLAIIPLLISLQWRLVADPPIMVGAIGVCWSLFFYWIGSHNYTACLELPKKALEAGEVNTYQELKERHLTSMGNHRSPLKVSIIIWLFSVIIVGFEMYGRLRIRILGVFSPEWASTTLRPYRLATIYIIGLVGIFLGWTLARLIIRHSFFLGRISYLKYRPSQHIYFLCLRPLFRINLLAAFGWSLGIAMVGVLFRSGYTPLRIIFLGVLGTVPTIAFFWPTWLFQEKLREIGMSRVETLVRTALEKLDLAVLDDARWPELFAWEEQISKQATDISFAIAWRYAAYLLTSFVIPVLTAVVVAIITSKS